MSILIRGMEMPEGCPFCPLSHWARGTDEFTGCEIVPGKRYAMLNDKAFAASLAKSRPEWCPLVPVPPHGRLIDADALLSQYKGNIWTAKTDYAEGLRDVANDIKQAPTIIEAEEEQG